MESGLQQIVKAPTRNDYLLDLVLTDLGESSSIKILPLISDHHGVLARFHFSLDTHETVSRSVWNFRSADWASISDYVSTLDFSFIDTEDVDLSTEKFTELLLETANALFPNVFLTKNLRVIHG